MTGPTTAPSPGARPAAVDGAAVRVRVPATSANLGPGFDAFGLALDLYDDVTARVVGTGVSVHVEGEGAQELPRDERHLVVQAMYDAFTALGVTPAGVELRCTNRIPHGRGLGSSAAAVVAGLLAARGLAPGGADMGDEELLALAAGREGHPDNVAPCLYGGFTIAWSEGGRDRAVRLEPAPQLRALAFVPAEPLPTVLARRLLPERVPHADAAHAAGRAGLLVEALTRRPELLLAATEDRLHQPYRAAAMPASAALLERLRAAGTPAVVSGAGPTVLVLGDGATLDRVVTRERAPGFAVIRLDLGGGAHAVP